MRKRAIAKIIVCSILAVLLTVSLMSVIACTDHTASASVLDGIFAVTPGIDPIRKGIEITEKSIQRLPAPDFHLFGIPGITFDYRDEDSEGLSDYAAGSGSYENAPKTVKIDWAAGRIVIGTHKGSGVELYEYSGDREIDLNNLPSDGGIAERDRMQHKMSGDELRIQMHKSYRVNISLFGISRNASLMSKTLVVLLPEAKLDRLEIDAAAASIELFDLAVRTLDFDTASGEVRADSCVFQSIDFDSAATDAVFTACEADRIELDTASCSVTFDLVNTPSRIDVDAMSGDFRFALPSDASFAIKMDSLASKVELNGFSSSRENGRTIVNGGNAQFEFDMAAGSVTIEARQDAKNTF